MTCYKGLKTREADSNHQTMAYAKRLTLEYLNPVRTCPNGHFSTK